MASVAALEKRPYVIGFAAETENLVEHAQAKLINKKLDMIIANQVGEQLGFEQEENAVIVLTADNQYEYTKMRKAQLARELIALIASLQS